MRRIHLSKAKKPPSRRAERIERVANTALERALETVATAPEHGRNDALNRAAFGLGQLLGAGLDHHDRKLFEDRLTAAALAKGLDASEISATIKSGLNAGIAKPSDLKRFMGARRARPRTRSAPERAQAAYRHLGDESDEQRRRAKELWEESAPAPGSAADSYLRGRAITCDLPPSLRFHPRVTMPDRGQHPALLAAVTDPRDGTLLAIQRTALREDGTGKATISPAKASLGSTSGGAVVLGDLRGSDDPIIEGEGIETVLSACSAMGWPGIASLSVSSLGKTPLPEGRAVVILADRGAENQVRAAANRRHSEGRQARLAIVPDDFQQGVSGVDANDLLCERGVDAVRAMIDSAVAFQPVLALAEALPDGFERRKDGWVLYCQPYRPNDEDECWAELCSPLEVVAATRAADGGSWGRLVRILNPDGRWGQRVIPMSWLAGDGRDMRAALLDLGLHLAEGSHSRAALTRLISHPPATRALCVNRLGWHDRAFVLPDRIFGDTAGEQVVWQPAEPTLHSFGTSGSLAGWQSSIAAPSAGNSRLVLALSTAFAAVLLGPLGREGGGFHFCGDTSTGKTTLLVVAGSVWGGGNGRYFRRWRATTNGLEGVAALHSDGLLCLDELAEVDGKEAYQAAYMLANGQGKQRAGKGGEARAPQTWRVLFLSSGELSLTEKIAEDGRQITAGQEVRVVDIPADAGAGLGLFECLYDVSDSDAFARRLTAAGQAHYGHPIRAFLDAVTSDLDTGLGLARQCMSDFEAANTPRDSSGQVRRVIARFALVAAGGELAIHYGVLPWRPGEAIAGTVRCMRDWLVHRGGSGNLPAARIITQVRAYIEAHGASRFAPLNDPDRVLDDRAGFTGIGDDGRRIWYALPEAWKGQICKGLDFRIAARVLADAGVLIHDGNSYQKRIRVEGLDQIRVYALTSDLLETDCLNRPSRLGA